MHTPPMHTLPEYTVPVPVPHRLYCAPGWNEFDDKNYGTGTKVLVHETCVQVQQQKCIVRGASVIQFALQTRYKYKSQPFSLYSESWSFCTYDHEHLQAQSDMTPIIASSFTGIGTSSQHYQHITSAKKLLMKRRWVVACLMLVFNKNMTPTFHGLQEKLELFDDSYSN